MGPAFNSEAPETCHASFAALARVGEGGRMHVPIRNKTCLSLGADTNATLVGTMRIHFGSKMDPSSKCD